MSIVVVGLSHKSAPIEVREKLNFPEDTLPDALRKLMTYEGIRESLIVSTCNRVEIYASVQDSVKGIDRIKQFIVDHHGLSREALDQSLYVYPDAQGVRHTFRVASSLDSLVLGEAQILGQLKDAFDIALKTKTTSTILNKLIKKAISVAKRVRTETKLAEGRVHQHRRGRAGEEDLRRPGREDCHAPGRRRDGGACSAAPSGQRRQEYHGGQPHLRTR
jgi:glutamyl-tRNA reductase